MIFSEDFESGIERWEVLDPETWKVMPGLTGNGFQIMRRESAYSPTYRSPGHVALVRDVSVGDVEITFKVRSTHDTGHHRDCCVFFGLQDAEHFYYAHLGAKPDPKSGQIMIVDGAARRPLTENTTPVPWTDGWHTVRLTRDVESGEVHVYFDDLETPLMSAVDTTFGAGRVGIGSFDDRNVFDDLTVAVPVAD